MSGTKQRVARLVLAVGVAFPSGGVAGQAGVPDADVVETRPFVADGYLRIMLMTEGTVRVEAWDRDSVGVTARLDDAAEPGWYFGTSGTGAGKLGVETRGSSGGRAEIEVRVPTGARLWIKTLGAPIHVIGVDGALDLYSVTGRIRIEGSPISLTAETMGGPIDLHGDPQVARLRSGAGGISVRGGGSDLTLHTVSGDVDVEARDPVRRLAAETVGGSVRIAGTLSRGASLSVISHDGAVTAELPAETGAEFLLVTLEGEIRNRLSAPGGEVSGLRGREQAFTAGTGGADVTIRTFSGTITIEPEGAGGG
jgi:hypothetical protein